MSTYRFQMELDQDDDGRWSATALALPGCSTWGHSKEEAVRHLEEAVSAYLDVLREDGYPFPQPITRIELVDKSVMVLPMPLG